MTSFLIEYDRKTGHSVMQAFPGPDGRGAAFAERLRREKTQSADSEIVVIEAASEDVVRRTHSRYFETPAELLRSI